MDERKNAGVFYAGQRIFDGLRKGGNINQNTAKKWIFDEM
jgi:hypothetical protein